MALGIVLWSRYVIAYLGMNKAFSKMANWVAGLFLLAVLLVTPFNRQWEIMFWFDTAGVYYGGPARDMLFVCQVLFLLVTSAYTFWAALKNTTTLKPRFFTVSFAGLIMMAFIAVQIFFPTYPLYAISYMMGGCLMRTFVVENEREEYRVNLEKALAREREQFQKLKRTWNLAYKDAMTGVKNKLAYVEKTSLLDRQIAAGSQHGFAVAVMDVNDLKQVNDTCGHEAGDEYIKAACRLICEVFKKSPVYRVGGDEFVAILEGDDYERRGTLLQKFNQQVEENQHHEAVVVAAGMAEYDAAQDDSYKQIFDRADARMYQRKRQLKMH